MTSLKYASHAGKADTAIVRAGAAHAAGVLNALPLPGLVLMEAEAARQVSLSVRSLQRLRVDGGGPPYIQLGLRRIGYRMADLEAWLTGRRVTSTSAAATGGSA